MKKSILEDNNVGEILFIISLIAFLVVPFVIVKLWWWAGMMAFIGATVGVTELLAKIFTGRTISQRFWYWSIYKDPSTGKKPNVWKAWTVIGCLCVGWGSLMLHLAWKMLTGQ